MNVFGLLTAMGGIYNWGFILMAAYGFFDAWIAALKRKGSDDVSKARTETERNALVMFTFAKVMAMALGNAFLWPVIFTLLCPPIVKRAYNWLVNRLDGPDQKSATNPKQPVVPPFPVEQQ